MAADRTVNQTAEPKAGSLREVSSPEGDPTASRRLCDWWREAQDADPVDAMNDAAYLARLCQQRLDRVLRQAANGYLRQYGREAYETQ